jgi:two-component system sensor histidine kinase KdpD
MRPRPRSLDYVFSVFIVSAETAVGLVMRGRTELTEIVMVYLLGVVFVASRCGRGPAVLASTLSVLAFNFGFVPPYYTLAVSELRFLGTFAVMFVVGLVVSDLYVRLREQSEVALRVQREELRNVLLSSVSHDLRTPLTAITGAASALLDETRPLPEPTKRDLLQTISAEAQRLNRLVRNLLDMTRVLAGGLQLRKEWVPLEEVIGSALNRLESILGPRRVVIDLPAELPLVPMDGVLMEQVYFNILENSSKYTPETATLEIRARAAPGMLTVAVSDDGPGLPPGSEDKVFDQFFRGPERRRDGVGLGLAICRGIVVAHGGVITAANRRPDGAAQGRGAVIGFTLPISGVPKALPSEPAREPSPHGAPP